MAELGINGGEYRYFSSAIAEASKLLGQESYLYPVASTKEDLYHDIRRGYGKPIQIGLFFVNNPQPILKRQHWLQENEEAYVGYISLYSTEYKALPIQEGVLIEIKTKYPIVETRYFKVSLVQALTIDPLMWVAKLVPYRQPVDLKPDTPVVQTVTQKPSSFNSHLINR